MHTITHDLFQSSPSWIRSTGIPRAGLEYELPWNREANPVAHRLINLRSRDIGNSWSLTSQMVITWSGPILVLSWPLKPYDLVATTYLKRQ
jgi:hypothetical protein